jgi:hypothetical protein
MSKSILSILALLSIGKSLCQSPIIGLFDGIEYGETNNAYYKDTQDDLDKFIGTWIWSDNNSSLTIEFRLLEQELITFSTDNSQFYTDLIIGEYIYVENGQELINTMHLFDSPFISNLDHNIAGNFIEDKAGRPYCDECTVSERRLKVFFTDPNYQHIENRAILRHLITAGQETIEMLLLQEYVNTVDNPYPQNPAEISMPYGSYTLIKQ